MKFKIFFSIIIPTFNPGKNLKDCLNSIKKLKDKTNFEVIIVDDKSTDNTLKVINKFRNDFCNFKLIKNKKNLGPGASRNLAINIAEGKYLVYLDSDDYFFPNLSKPESLNYLYQIK
jgi:glycosyltransferase involved in cell wall biosynthesis